MNKLFYIVLISTILSGCSIATTIGKTAVIAIDSYCELHPTQREAVGYSVNSEIQPHYILIECGEQ